MLFFLLCFIPGGGWHERLFEADLQIFEVEVEVDSKMEVNELYMGNRGIWEEHWASFRREQQCMSDHYYHQISSQEQACSVVLRWVSTSTMNRCGMLQDYVISNIIQTWTSLRHLRNVAVRDEGILLNLLLSSFNPSFRCLSFSKRDLFYSFRSCYNTRQMNYLLFSLSMCWRRTRLPDHLLFILFLLTCEWRGSIKRRLLTILLRVTFMSCNLWLVWAGRMNISIWFSARILNNRTPYWIRVSQQQWQRGTCRKSKSCFPYESNETWFQCQQVMIILTNAETELNRKGCGSVWIATRADTSDFGY